MITKKENQALREIAVGIRIHPKEGISFFGIEEINATINFGGKVTAIEGGGAVMRKAEDREGTVHLTLSGCDMKVMVDESGTENSPAREEHDRVYQDGSALIKPYMHIVNRGHQSADSEEARAELEQGIALMREALAINPANWPAYWMIGKAYQALGDSEQACEAFRQSFSLHKGNVDVAREYMFECLNLGQMEKGVVAAEHAVKLEPENPGLLANLGLACFLAEKLDLAANAIEKSLAISPEDEITQNLNQALADVQAGRSPQPTSMADLEKL